MKRILQSSILVARTRLGRNLKIALFIAGAILPLGSLIWLALLAHGQAVTRRRESAVGLGATPSGAR